MLWKMETKWQDQREVCPDEVCPDEVCPDASRYKTRINSFYVMCHKVPYFIQDTDL